DEGRRRAAGAAEARDDVGPSGRALEHRRLDAGGGELGREQIGGGPLAPGRVRRVDADQRLAQADGLVGERGFVEHDDVRYSTLRLAALLLLIAVPAHAYEENVHALLEARALDPELRATPVAPPTVEDADALAAAIWKVGAAHPDADLRRRFL